MTVKTFLLKVLDSNDPLSAKRFATLITLFHFILTAFLVTFFVFYLLLYNPKGAVNKDLLNLLEKILESELYIIMGGLGLMAVADIGNVFVQRMKSKMIGDVAGTSDAASNKVADAITSIATTCAPDPEGEYTLPK